MKHVKLFEAFTSQGEYRAISVFPDGGSALYVGVFPLRKSEMIYQALSSLPGIKVEIINLPDDHDVIVSKLGGEGLATGRNEDFGWYNPIKAGEDHEFMGDEEHGVAFWADRDLEAFVMVNGFGGTTVVAPGELIEICKETSY